MQEVIMVAQQSGVPLGDDLVDRLFHKILNMDGVYSSMYVDSKEGRAMEVEVILGTPLKKARELGVDVPTLSVMYSTIYAIDARLSRARSE